MESTIKTDKNDKFYDGHKRSDKSTVFSWKNKIILEKGISWHGKMFKMYHWADIRSPK